MEKFRDLPDNSPDIESDNMIKRYQRRPKQLENVCLADYVAWHNYRSESRLAKRKPKANSFTDDFIVENDFDEKNDDDIQDESRNDENQNLKLKIGMTLTKRQRPIIIL